jgi:hypothetical protein
MQNKAVPAHGAIVTKRGLTSRNANTVQTDTRRPKFPAQQRHHVASASLYSPPANAVLKPYPPSPAPRVEPPLSSPDHGELLPENPSISMVASRLPSYGFRLFLSQADVDVETGVTAVGQPKKRTFRKYSYRGVDLDSLLDMSTDDLVQLFPARARRR